MKIDLTCPVEAWKVTLPTADTPECDVTLFNLSAQQVVSVEVTIVFSSADGEESAKVTHRGRALAGSPGKTFHMTVPVERRIHAEVYEVTVDKVWYDNSSVWRRDKETPLTEYEPNHLHRSSQLTTLRAIAGDMASGYPDQQEGLWVCVCGRPNLDAENTCIRCHREKAEVFRKYSREAIDAVVSARDAELTAKGREVLQAASREREGEHDRVRRKRKSGRFIKAGVAVAAVAVLAYGGVFHALPRVKYELACRDSQQAETIEAYAAAEEAFSALPGYRDADEQAQRSRYARALLLKDSDKVEELLAARALLTSLQESDLEATADVRNAIPGHIHDIDTAHADILLSQGDLDGAEPLYAAVGDAYAKGQLTDIAYQRAVAIYDNGEWAAARAAFEALGDYKDSEARILDAWYYEGTQALDAGKAEEGIAILASIPGHRDADERILKHHYEQGVALRAEGKLDEAAEAFYAAIGYEDAEAQANECFYDPAVVAYDTFDYERAAQLFSKILPYRDAQEKWQQSVYEAAKKCMAEIRYADAAAWLRQLPADYQDAATLLLDCTYQPAKNAYIRGDFAEAIEGFTAVIDHRDSAEMANKARYDWAGELQNAGQTAQAEALYAQLGQYSDSAARLNGIRSSSADALAASGTEKDLAEAIRIYTELGAYNDSAAKLQAAQYALAAQVLARGAYAEAKDMFLALGTYGDSAAQVRACDYGLAMDLAKSGDAQAALAAFEALGDHADAAAQANQIRYEAAAALAADGKAEEALAAFEGLGDFSDAPTRALQIRYDMALALSETDPEAALTAFEALGDFSDAANQAKALRYDAAEALLATDPTGALAAFLALGDYADAADQAAKLLYADAEAIALTGDWQTAAAAFDAISTYQDAAERADQLRYDAAMAYADAGDWANAQATFEAMGNGSNATEQVNALRYDAAEKLLAEGQRETAAAAFAAIGAYQDAADRANALRYEDAETLLQKGETERAATAFLALGDYKDAADRAMQIRYEAAEALADAAKWDEAIAAFEALIPYGNAADRVTQLRYNKAAALAAGGQWDEAVAAFEALGDYADSAARIPRTRYEQAASLAAQGEYIAAAEVYKALGDYEDARTQVSVMYEAYYGNAASILATAREAKNYTHIYLQMRSMDLSHLPQEYAYLEAMYQEACYYEGKRLFDEGRPYEAYACYTELPTSYKDVATILQRPCYLILGAWTDQNGLRYHFEGNGTCTLNGVSYYFTVDGTNISTGKDITQLALTHRLSGVTTKNAMLYDMTGAEEVSRYLTRVE